MSFVGDVSTPGRAEGSPLKTRVGRGHWKRPSAEERFWARVEKGGEDDCWEWTAGKFTAGYGGLGVDGKTVYAHRFSYELHKGPIPEGAHLLHSCDNPGCVNPAHLTAGTPKENIRDAVKKGRWMTDARKQYLDTVAEHPKDANGKWL